jgi:small subunit ribosomal protein S2
MKASIEEMVQCGLHFGHQARKWDPKMAQFIYKEHNGVHIIDLIKTQAYLKQVCGFLAEAGAADKTILFVGTKKQASGLIAKVALQSNSPYVNQRWLGGMLTNWKTIKSSIKKLNDLDYEEKTGGFDLITKQEAAQARKQQARLQKYLGGMKHMTTLPDIVVIVGQPDELNAVAECKRLGIRSVTILDTDCNPSLADLFVPANDDSVASLQLILTEFLRAILTGQQIGNAKQQRKAR